MNKLQYWKQSVNIKYFAIAVGIVLLWFLNQGTFFSQPSQDDLFAIEETAEWDQTSSVEQSSESSVEPLIIYAEIKGAVQHPGVYSFNEGDRVMDLVHAAGGVTDEAALEAINQALLIQDQMSLTVPTFDEWQIQKETVDLADQTTLDGIQTEMSTSTLVNINTADSQQLQTLPGIGPKKAEAIIAYRDENGSFQAIEDIMAISGIGEKTFEQLAPLIQVGP